NAARARVTTPARRIIHPITHCTRSDRRRGRRSTGRSGMCCDIATPRLAARVPRRRHLPLTRRQSAVCPIRGRRATIVFPLVTHVPDGGRARYPLRVYKGVTP